MATTEKIRLLHIDDDQYFLEIFRSTYRDEFDILSRPSGEDILELLDSEHIDAMVVDYNLPGQNGLDILKDVRARFPSMPLVFYTGQGNEEVARQAFKAGATDYFVKEASDFVQKEKVVNSVQRAVEKCAVEAELAEKQAMLESIIEHNPYSIQIHDGEGHPISANRAHRKLFGASPLYDGGVIFDEDLAIPDETKEMIQAEWREGKKGYTAFNDPAPYKDERAMECLKSWQDGDVVKFPPIWYTTPFPVTRATLKPRCMAATGFSTRDSRGRFAHFVLMHEDITARAEAEEALRKAHEELQYAYAHVEQRVSERTAELARANTRLQAEIGERDRLQSELEKRNGELEDFAHMVSHDLRNNLLAMRRMMEMGALMKTDMKEANESLIASMSGLQRFVERLLTLAQAGKSIGPRMMISPALIARKAFPEVAAAHDGARLKITPRIPAVRGDPFAIEQIFANLFANALSHARQGVKPVISLGFTAGEGTIDLVVKDNGSGIDPAIMPRIFDAAFTTRKKGRGGFGLAIVKKLAEAHGGSVRAESRGPGKGASFIITLPHEA